MSLPPLSRETLEGRTGGTSSAWISLAIGVAEFAVLTPGLLLGFTAARLVIGLWMLLFALLGWSLLVEAPA